MSLSPDIADKVKEVMRAVDADFAKLAEIAKLDPRRHFQGADLRDVNFGTDDLSGFDFRCADLRGADLSAARGLQKWMLHGATLEGARLPAGWSLAALARPIWASAMGRDGFGLWCEIAVGKATQRLRWINPGRFLMGSPEGEEGRFDDEGPQHEVTISKGFWLFDTPCTQALWQAVMGKNPSEFKSPDRPVETVSFDDVQQFIARIGTKIPGLQLALPSEAQWEYACRAGTPTASYAGDLKILGANNAPALDPIAWYGGNSGRDFDLKKGFDSSDWPERQYDHKKAGTRRVREKRPNDGGLYDMLGNVWEWCLDGKRGYEAGGIMDPVGVIGSAEWRVVRGGSWYDAAQGARSACRGTLDPDVSLGHLGFRCAQVQE
jgi:formylglycine-generating enzyme required for sulfatase activity